MATLTLRNVKGSILSFQEMDSNFLALDSATTNLFSTKTTSDLAEGSNLYYTTIRFDSDFSNNTTSDLNEGTNLYYTTGRFDSDFNSKSTSNLSEGSNLYYTTARFDSDFGDNTTSDLTEGNNLYYTTARADSDFDARLASKTTSDLSEGSNKYYATARFDSDFGDKTTTDLAEGTNLYYTLARVDSAIDVHLGSSTGIFLDTTEKLYYSNVFSNEGDLPNATTYHGMFAHVHGTGRGYFAHAGNWIKLLDSSTGITTSQVTEGSRLYYTTARFDSDFGDNTTTDLTEGNNLYYTQSRVDSSFDVRLATKTTDNLTEGSNLYYTTARVDSAIDVHLGSSSGIFLDTTEKLYYSNVFSAEGDLPSATTYHGMFAHVHGTGRGYFAHAGNWVKLLDSDTGVTTSQVTEGSGLYYTTARFDSDFGDNSTTDLSEGSNLYYTQSRVDSAFDVRLATKTTDNLTEGSNLYYTTARHDSDTGVYLGASTGIFLATTDKLYYSNVFSAEGDLPSATTYHGMFAHVHGTGKGYFAHAGNWVKLLDETSSTTSNLSEGTNLYYTTARFDSDFGDNSTSDLTEGTNLYYTTTRFDSDFNDKTTTNLSEGTNLYYTKARVDSDITSSFVSYDMTGASASTTSTTQTAIATFAAASYSGAKAVITATDSDTSVRQISELLITHNNTTAEAVQYATVCTSGTDDDIATYDVDLNSGNVRILTTSASTNTTHYKVALTLLD